MIESPMYESRQTTFHIFGIVVALAGTLQALSPFAAGAEENSNLPENRRKSSTPNPKLYDEFAGGKGRREWSDNGLKMKFVWCRSGHPERVGLKKPNPWGLHDMHGNVLEWCRDLDNNKPHPGGRDPEVTEGRHRVQRGGYFASLASGCRSGARYMEPAELKKREFGFRVALRYLD